MPLVRTRLSLVRTGRWRPEYELREDGRPVGRLLLGVRPGSPAATASVGDRTWTLTPGSCRSSVDATAADGSVGAALRDGEITLGDATRPTVTWRRNRTVGACAELTAHGCQATLRIRRRTAPGLDVAIDGDLLERELLVLLAGYDLLR
ncbi:hypothetical protein [Patulibacter sp.]|uniref:hypothetical protein n=1 Tax=Patulibacter sp. TaxID=1912859 RepID=UPI00271FD9F7|nr:hypothetical protein [Patulibacter sp.]MDO9410623.1 hypothetical protein [Patulibacter sp.]